MSIANTVTGMKRLDKNVSSRSSAKSKRHLSERSRSKSRPASSKRLRRRSDARLRRKRQPTRKLALPHSALRLKPPKKGSARSGLSLRTWTAMKAAMMTNPRGSHQTRARLLPARSCPKRQPARPMIPHHHQRLLSLLPHHHFPVPQWAARQPSSRHLRSRRTPSGRA